MRRRLIIWTIRILETTFGCKATFPVNIRLVRVLDRLDAKRGKGTA